jgi:hypothetical protein
VFLVDTVEVEADRTDEYLRTVEELGVPVMTEAGATLVSCASTPRDIGEPVHVQIIWSFRDYAEWNVIRKNLVLDPRWYEYGARASALRTSGHRRFYQPASFSP